MTPIGQPCTCEPMTWLYFVLVQSVLVFVGQTLSLVDPAAFVAGDGGYCARAVLALAAATPTQDFPAAAARQHALRLAAAYGVDPVEVAMAHAG
jgi:hypothetical protein